MEYYNLDLFSTYEKDRFRAYGLIGNLPKTSRTIESELGGPSLDYSSIMLAKIELLIRHYFWVSSDSRTRGSAPEIDLPKYIVDLNNKSIEKFTQDDIDRVNDWIYDPGFTTPVENYK